MKISVIGTGYVGLVTGTCFAEVGIDTTCVDIDVAKIENLKKGISPIYEPGLDLLIQENSAKNKLHFSTDFELSIADAEVIFIAVGTPPDEDGSADLKYIIEVARNIGKSMSSYKLVVTKSTVPIGTASKVIETISLELKRRNLKIDFDVASNPEFLKEGDAINDFMKPDRIVIGVESERAELLLSKLYKPFTLNGHQIIFMNIVSAELTKYVANSMLATRISFMNEVANLCEIVGADIKMIRKGIGSDSRIGDKFLYAGIGYGGSCFPKDVKALIKTAEENNYSLKVIKAVEEVNDKQKIVIFNKIQKYFNRNLKKKVVAIWGLAFKPNTDDMREAPSIELIKQLNEAGSIVKVYDPVAIGEAKKQLGNLVYYASDPYDATKNADCLVLVTEWNDFRSPDWKKIKASMNNPTIFDGRNIYDLKEMKTFGFEYFGIGVNNEIMNQL
jgi:UDPglucose 6-dehydrogenase